MERSSQLRVRRYRCSRRLYLALVTDIVARGLSSAYSVPQIQPNLPNYVEVSSLPQSGAWPSRRPHTFLPLLQTKERSTSGTFAHRDPQKITPVKHQRQRNATRSAASTTTTTRYPTPLVPRHRCPAPWPQQQATCLHQPIYDMPLQPTHRQ